MKGLIIANPNATTSNAESERRIVQHLSGVSDLQLRTQFTHYPNHAAEMVAGLRRSDYEVIIVIGGDGTVHEVINGLLGTPGEQPAAESLPRLLIIPGGSANVFARALGMPADPATAAEMGARLLTKLQYKPVDLGTWNQRWFAVNAGFGIDADVVAGMERVRSKGFRATPLRYLHFGVRSWLRLHTQPPHIRFKLRTRQGRNASFADVPLLFITNTNPWTFLGPLPVVTNPKTDLNRGLGVYALRDARGVGGVLAMGNLIGLGQSSLAQRIIADRRVRFDDADTIEVECRSPLKFQVDGEYIGEFSEMRLGAVQQALEVFAPQEPAAASPLSWLRTLRNFLSVRIW